MSEKNVAAVSIETDDGYADLEKLVRARVAAQSGPVFYTDVDPDQLWAAYLNGIAAGTEDGEVQAKKRQHYNCNCCKRFIQRYGSLVTVEKGGFIEPLLWTGNAPGDWPEFFRTAILAMRKLLLASRINGVVVNTEEVWGTPVTGAWTHLAAKTNPDYRQDLTPEDSALREAVLKEDHGVLSRGLAEYNKDVAVQAVRVLNADALTRSEKGLAVAQWFLKLHEQLENVQQHHRRSDLKRNLVWLAVATAPVGFSHVKNTMVGTLMDDIKAGLDFNDVKARWGKKLHPLRYQRAQAAPTDGQLDSAERLITKLGVQRALARRAARLEEVRVKLWEPAVVLVMEEEGTGGVFDHLRRSGAGKGKVKSIEIPPVEISWEKFSAKVLPTALSMEVLIKVGGQPFYGLATATDPDAPPIYQWDGLEGCPRNPVSWYFWHGGSYAQHWALTPGTRVKVNAVFLPPHQWDRPEQFRTHSMGAFFALDGAVEQKTPKMCLFPDHLKSSLYAARSVIEAYSQSGTITGTKEGTANGLALMKNEGDRVSMPVTVYVTDAGGSAGYIINRWE
jgi:hypothetical protein